MRHSMPDWPSCILADAIQRPRRLSTDASFDARWAMLLSCICHPAASAFNHGCVIRCPIGHAAFLQMPSSGLGVYPRMRHSMPDGPRCFLVYAIQRPLPLSTDASFDASRAILYSCIRPSHMCFFTEGGGQD